MRATIESQRFEISTKRYTHPDLWSAISNKMKGNTEKAKSVNSTLDSMRAKVYDYQKLLQRFTSHLGVRLL